MTKNSKGRPSKITEQIANKIIDLISDGSTLNEVCAMKDMPSRWSVSRAMQSNEDFRTRYAQARIDQMHTFADKILEVSNDETRDYYIDSRGDRKSDNTAVMRDRLKVDSMKFLMARLASQYYGDKIQQEITGKDGKDLIPIINISVTKKT